MDNNHNFNHSLPPEILEQLPAEVQNYYLTGRQNEEREKQALMEENEGKLRIKKEQNDKIQEEEKQAINQRISRLKDSTNKFIPESFISLTVVVIGALIFGMSGYEIARNTGRGQFALASGVLIGSLMSIFAENNGREVFTSLAMYEIYKELE
ncbi:MAG: hypothetical protein QNJ47_10465 [Nostocaceae cyanobacterium]|nr:hypothetical protein [Nostocaceae cyanobacterium]